MENLGIYVKRFDGFVVIIKRRPSTCSHCGRLKNGHALYQVWGATIVS